MADTARKSVNLAGQALKSCNVDPLLALSPVEWAPLAAVMRAQDSIPGTANRVLVRVGLAGSHEFPVDDSLALETPAQSHPEAETWRTIWGPLSRRQTPGTELAAHVIYLPSGPTQREDISDGSWDADGARGGIRVVANWTNGAATDSATFELDLEGSGLPNGAEPTAAGSAWAAIREALIEQIRPPGSGIDPAIAQDFSEWGPGSHADAGTLQHEVTLEIQIRGGARLVECIVYEVPLGHVEDHDETDPQSVAAFSVGGGPPITPQTPVPQTEAADGPTYQEHRFGTRRLVETADWQSQRLGPAVAEASSWVSAAGPPFPTEPDPWTVDGTLVDLVTGDAGYDAGRASWIVSGAYAKPHASNDAGQIMAGGGRAVIPCRVRVLARTDSATYGATVRFQSSALEWIDVRIPAALADVEEFTAVGWLTCQVHPDHATAELAVLGSVDRAPAILEVRGWAIDFGAW